MLKKFVVAAAAAAALAATAHAGERNIGLVDDPLVPHEFVVDPTISREVFDSTPVARWTDGPFMVAVDPDGVITRSTRPLTLYPKEWSAMAQDRLPADCPSATAKEDKAECE